MGDFAGMRWHISTDELVRRFDMSQSARKRKVGALDEEMKFSKVNLRSMRAQGGRFLAFAYMVSDFREHVDNPGLAIGIVKELKRKLTNPKGRAELQAEGDATYAQIRGKPRTPNREILVQVGPDVASSVAMSLIGAGLRGSEKPTASGWAEFRGAVDAAELGPILERIKHRIIELQVFTPEPEEGEQDRHETQASPAESTPVTGAADIPVDEDAERPPSLSVGAPDPAKGVTVADLDELLRQLDGPASGVTRQGAAATSSEPAVLPSVRPSAFPLLSPRPLVPGEPRPVQTRVEASAAQHSATSLPDRDAATMVPDKRSGADTGSPLTTPDPVVA